MSDLKSILKNMVVLGILVFAIMSFVIIIQLDSGLDSSERITNNSLINDSYGDLQSSLNQQEGSENALNALEVMI